MSAIRLTVDVRVGDLITELDTPEGPFYPVLKVNPKSLVIDGGGFTLRIPTNPRAAVLVKVAA